MSDSRDGRSFLIPRNRRLTWDLLHYNRSVPLCGHDRNCDLSELAAARDACPTRISWPALFLKAYGLVALEYPELRQIWYRWPWAHLYQHPHSVATMTVQREHKGVPWLFLGRIVEPESQSLEEIQKQIDEYKNGPTRPQFKKELHVASFPTFIRRLFWSWNVNIAKAGRVAQLGTFFMSTLSGKGVEIQVPPSIQTGCLTYGPLSTSGVSRITLAYDHRIMDGSLVADILIRLESHLSETLRAELLQLSSSTENMRIAA